MTEKDLSARISKLISPDAGDSEPLTDEERKYAKESIDGLSTLFPDDQVLAFENLGRSQGRCGFASGGHHDYLINTDSGNRGRVTVRTYWRQGINSGQYDRMYVSEAGGRHNLGCSGSGSIPVACCRCNVVCR